ncbi:hypothetical protein Trisim1_000569 [Trichoderma cf. simile WF8]
MTTVVNGALSAVVLFNNCVDTFGYIKLGLKFGEDYQRYQLKLDVAETRLGRWGEAVGVNSDERFASASPTDEAVKNALEILMDLKTCFEVAQNKSRRYAGNADEKEPTVHDINDMNPTFQQLHNRSKDIARRRQKGISIVKKTAWALYDRKSFDNIVNQIVSWVDELEKLFPTEVACQKFIKMEINEVNDEPSLTALKDAAHGIDPALEHTVKHKVDSIGGRNSARNIRMENRARVHVGNIVAERVLQHEVRVNDQANNVAEDIIARDDARGHIGNVWGGRSIWDD